MDDRVVEAESNHRITGEALCRTVSEVYPVGMILVVALGNAEIKVRVTGHSSFWWSRPGEIKGTNINTNKERRFYADSIIGG